MIKCKWWFAQVTTG